MEEARARLEARRAATAAMRADFNAAQSNEPPHRARAGAHAEPRQNDFVSRRELDEAQAAHETAAAVLDATQRRLAQTEGDIQQAEAELPPACSASSNPGRRWRSRAGRSRARRGRATRWP